MQLNNILEICRILPQANCKKCGFSTCLAFAVAVFKGQKTLIHCSEMDGDRAGQFTVKIEQNQTIMQQQGVLYEQLKSKIAQMDFTMMAARLGGSLSDGKLSIKCLGRDFTVDTRGNIYSDCHVIPWVTVPLLDYIITSTGANPSGIWVPLRELPDGSVRDLMFWQKCITPLKQIADDHFDLFRDVLSIFGGKDVDTGFDVDVAAVVHLLPKVPLLISYIKPEEEIPSQLNIFFDTTATEHLDMELLYILVTGFVIMLDKIRQRHG